MTTEKPKPTVAGRMEELPMCPYKQRIMNNVHRSEYVECLVAIALEDNLGTPRALVGA